MEIEIGDLSDLRTFFDAHNGRLNIDFDVFAEKLKDWEVWRLIDWEIIAIILKKGEYGHIANNGTKVGIKRMKFALDRLGIKKTTVGQQFKKGHALAKRLGFHVEMTANGVTYYVRCG